MEILNRTLSGLFLLLILVMVYLSFTYPFNTVIEQIYIVLAPACVAITCYVVLKLIHLMVKGE